MMNPLKRIREEAFGPRLLQDQSHTGNEDQERKMIQTKKLSAITMVSSILTVCSVYFLSPAVPHFRRPNVHRDRTHALEFIRSWDDDMFHRQTRLERADFIPLLQSIAPLISKNEHMARVSSGSAINPELLLVMTLRLLAGAQYLDMIWYQISIDHIWDYVNPVLVAIHRTIQMSTFLTLKKRSTSRFQIGISTWTGNFLAWTCFLESRAQSMASLLNGLSQVRVSCVDETTGTI